VFGPDCRPWPRPGYRHDGPPRALLSLHHGAVSGLRSVTEGAGRCFSGDIGVISSDPNRTGWLQVEARDGEGVEAIPYFYPGTLGITRRVIEERRVEAVKDPFGDRDPDFLQAISAFNPINQEYLPPVFARYQAFLKRMRACIKLPVLDGNTVIAVVSLHIDKPVSAFADGLLQVLKGLVAHARTPAQNLVRDQDPLGSGAWETPHVLRQIVSGTVTGSPGSLSETRKQLSRDLAETALKLAGAYRTAVRILSPDREKLLTMGTAGPRFPPEFYDREHPLGDEGTSAASFAVRTGEDYYIPDITVKEKHYQSWGEVCEGGHASVLLRHAGQTLGVLSVDWREPRGFSQTLKRDLRRLADSYAFALKGVFIDARFPELDLKVDNPQEFVRLACELTGGTCAALYRRNPVTGLFELDRKACHGHSEEWLSTSTRREGYGQGEGFISWVVRQGKLLRVADRKDTAELARFTPPPVWRDHDPFDREWGKRVVAWMGVPVWADRELVAVLRIASERAGEGFSPFDAKTAELAAARLGNNLLRQQEKERRGAIIDFGIELQSLANPVELGAAVFRLLEKGIGPCSGGLRVHDFRGLPDGRLQPVMRRLYANQEYWWQNTDLYRVRGIGITGWVWENRLSYVSSDPAVPSHDQLRVDEKTEAVLRDYKEHACFPLLHGDEVLGTLHIARKVAGTLLSVRGFCEEVVRLTTAALRRLDYQRLRQFELEVRRLPIRPSRAWAEQTIPHLLTFCGAAWGLVWWVEPGSTLARGSSADETTFSTDDLRSRLGPEGIRLVSDPDHDASLRAVFAPLAGRLPHGWERCHQAAITIERSGRERAVFAVLTGPNTALGYHPIKEARELLQDLFQEGG
jgi:GAF domain-containing protein